MVDEEQLRKVESEPGFIAALDQSGGSTPKALELYGIDSSEYSSDEEMFTLMHRMRSRMITSPAFGGDRILGVILFGAGIGNATSLPPTIAQTVFV